MIRFYVKKYGLIFFSFCQFKLLCYMFSELNDIFVRCQIHFIVLHLYLAYVSCTICVALCHEPWTYGLNPGGAASPTKSAAPQGHGYDTRFILFLPNPNEDLTSSYVDVRNPLQ
jgi:hypothetical protein